VSELAPEILDGLPEASLERHVAILGTSDAGKTYAARGEVERLLDAGRNVCVIDPTGVWWGLGYLPDGKKRSEYMPCLWQHPKAEEGEGELQAQHVADREGCTILDVSRLTVGQRTRFFAEFAETLARVNREKVLHLVIDEAHLFAPQGRVYDVASGRMVHAANHLVAGGRALGIRVMMLSQRPAKLHKDSLTQVQTLVAMLNVSPQDRAAVKAWITDSADPVRGAEIMASLPGLGVGEGWIWAPRLDVLSRVKFRPIRTFDSSATPEHGHPQAGGRLAPTREMAVSVFDVDDEMAAAERRGFERGSARVIEVGLQERKAGYAEGWKAAAAAVLSALDPKPVTIAEVRARQEAPPAVESATAKAPRTPAPKPSSSNGDQLLRALQGSPYYWTSWEDVGVLAVLSPKGGHFRRERLALLESGRAIEEGGKVRLRDPDPDLADADELVKAWCSKLGGSAAKFLPLIWYSEGSLSVDEVCEKLGLAWSGGYARTGFKALRNYGLVVERNGRLSPAEVLVALNDAPAGAS
jgi:hypothetical protein